MPNTHTRHHLGAVRGGDGGDGGRDGLCLSVCLSCHTHEDSHLGAVGGGDGGDWGRDELPLRRCDERPKPRQHRPLRVCVCVRACV